MRSETWKTGNRLQYYARISKVATDLLRDRVMLSPSGPILNDGIRLSEPSCDMGRTKVEWS
jgi:hypothetical protein